ncbi:hypothetical protein [Pendulispora albinea]|uniref:Uncharacterized protein n=1 Tax=Pendulispora albinea TaxID=2741071 RepID=A0ABZ2M2T1_9BACT
MMEARLDGDDVEAIAYLGQKPTMRMLVGRDDRPVNLETIAGHEEAILAHLRSTMGFRTEVGTCEAGAVLRLDKDPDGEAVRVVRRYHCRGASKSGIEATFRPFLADQPFKIFLLGIFFANGKTQAHTFTGSPIWLHPETFGEPARADRLALFPALFPPLERPSAPQILRGGLTALFATAGLVVLALIGLGARRIHRQPSG